MAASSLYVLHALLTRRRDSAHPTPAVKSFFFYMPTTLALATTLLILLYISSTSNIFIIHPLTRPRIGGSPLNFVNSSKIPTRGGGVGVAEDRRGVRIEMGIHG